MVNSSLREELRTENRYTVYGDIACKIHPITDAEVSTLAESNPELSSIDLQPEIHFMPVDVSKKGVGLIALKPIAVGNHFVMVIGEEDKRILLKVVHCREAPIGMPGLSGPTVPGEATLGFAVWRVGFFVIEQRLYGCKDSKRSDLFP
ncbi:MAG: hypothetical protein EOP06_04040 [Proteobacteria bacterium]|nr:MAG: hypothetical protein EOP06_04040 [Pseudomonadota bacterium]